MGTAPIQFALAGMNAHINRDLPLALVETCDELGGSSSAMTEPRSTATFSPLNALLQSHRDAG